MRRRYTTASLLLVLSISGCSSRPPALTLLSPGALPGGTAQVTVNGRGTGKIRAVECERIGKGLTAILLGSPDKQITALLSPDKPEAVTFNDADGFTGGYWRDLQGSAELDMVDQTYTLTGTAVGFNTENPHARSTNGFAIKVAC